MKRCPQCEFIYEDDQSHCDMDGARLNHDAHALPKLQALTTTRSATLEKPKARNRIFAGAAMLVLALVMALVYYVSFRHSPRTTTVAISPTVEAAQPNPEPSPVAASDNTVAPQTADTPTEKRSEPNATDAAPVTEPDSRNPEAKPSPQPDTDSETKSTSQTRRTSQPGTTTAKPQEKKDSKVESAIKKTGRFFKKVF